MVSRKSLNINGEHSTLGNELKMAEFKGYTVSELDNIKSILNSMKEDYLRESKAVKECFEKHVEENEIGFRKLERDIGILNQFKAQVFAIASLMGLVGGAVVAFFLRFFGGG